MGTAESKSNHRHRSSKQLRYKSETLTIPKCQHTNKQFKRLIGENKNLSKEKNETIVPFITSLPLNPNLQGSIVNHSFPMQRSHSEIQIIPYESSHNEILGNSNEFVHDTHKHPKGVYDYRKHMQRVDEENRPVLEGLCPDKMYVSTNDLRICDTQRLPPPLRCKITQGFFRPISPSKFHQKKLPLNSSFL